MQSLDTQLAGLLSVMLEPFTHYAYSLSAFSILVLLAVVITIRMKRVQRKILEERSLMAPVRLRVMRILRHFLQPLALSMRRLARTIP